MADLSKSVRRFDALGALEPPKRMPNGYLRVEAFLTRTGVFPYRRADGSVIREYRSPEEVFRADSVESFGQLPVTIEHPPVPGGLLDPSNTHQFQVGAVGNLQRVGNRMKGSIVVTDAKAQTELESGRKREISFGYVCDLDMTPGVSPEGESYDAVQRNIIGNHCAITKMARGGSDLRVRMDSADAEMISSEEIKIPGENPAPGETMSTRKVKLDGMDVEVPVAVADAIDSAKARLDSALAAQKADHDKAITEAKGETAKAVARADAAEAKIKTMSGELAAAPAKALAAAKARADLETTARGVLGSGAKFDAADGKPMDDATIKAAVVLKLSGDDMTGKDPVYVAARFDSEIALNTRTNPALAAARVASGPAPTAPAGVRTDSATDEYLNVIMHKTPAAK
jgi:hypothetical protein